MELLEKISSEIASALKTSWRSRVSKGGWIRAGIAPAREKLCRKLNLWTPS